MKLSAHAKHLLIGTAVPTVVVIGAVTAVQVVIPTVTQNSVTTLRPGTQASQLSLNCALPEVAGQTNSALAAYYSHPAIPGQAPVVPKAAEHFFNACVDLGSARDKQAATVASYAEHRLPAEIASLFNEPGAAPLPNETPAQLSAIKTQARSLATGCVSFEVAQLTPGALLASSSTRQKAAYDADNCVTNTAKAQNINSVAEIFALSEAPSALEAEIEHIEAVHGI